MHTCETCGKQCVSPSKLERHVRSHARQPTLCDVCGKSFEGPAKLARHQGVHASSEKECDQCEKKFKTDAQLEHHKKCHSHPCKECGEVFENRWKLNRHAATHDPRYTCEECGQVFLCPFAWDRHKGESHAYVKCRVCGRRWKNEVERDEHESAHSPTMLAEVIAEEEADMGLERRKFRSLDEYEANVRQTIKENMAAISDWENLGKIRHQYNIKVDGFDIKAIEAKLRHIFKKSGKAFKVRILAGFILKTRDKDHVWTPGIDNNSDEDSDDEGAEAARYFEPGGNSNILGDTMVVGNAAELYEVFDTLRNVDINQALTVDRPSTKYFLGDITNFLVEVYWTKFTR